MKQISFMLAVLSLTLAGSCRELTPEELQGRAEGKETVETVKFLLDQQSRVSLDATTLKMSFQKGDQIAVNDVICPVQIDEEGNPFIEVAKSADDMYYSIFSGPQSYIGSSDNNYKVPNFQLYREDGIGPDAMPLVSSKDMKNDKDRVLRFKPVMGVVKIPVSAEGVSIRSIKLEDRGFDKASGKTYMSGRAVPVEKDGTEVKFVGDEIHHFTFSKAGTAVMREIVLLCNDEQGNGVTVSGTKDFYIVVEPRNYTNGLVVTINDNNHRSMTVHTEGSTSVGVGEVVTMKPITCSFDEKQIFAENFDTCVWGGDPVGQKTGYSGYRCLLPCSASNTTGTFAGRSYVGNERGHWYSDNKTGTDAGGNSVMVLAPGSDIMANYEAKVFSNTYYDMSVNTERIMSESYFKIRGLWDWYVSRTIEYHGYIMVGRSGSFNSVDYAKGVTATGSPQGGIHTPRMLNIPEGQSRDIKLTFKLAKDYLSPFQPFRLCCYGAGAIQSIACGTLETQIDTAGIAFIPGISEIGNDWVNVEVIVKGATNATFFQFYTPDGKDDAGKAIKLSTYYLDDILVEETDIEKSQPKRIGFLGDSITTFAGYSEGGSNFYPYTDPNGDISKSLTRVQDTYWYKIVNNLCTNATLDKALAYGGTTVINNQKNPRTDFLYRCTGFDRPDIIFIHGGTNDKNYSSPLGEYDYDKSEDQLDETCFRSAYIKLIKMLQRMHPKAQLLIIVGDMLTEPYYTSVEAIADHFGIPYVSFTGYNIPKCTGSHPNPAGMDTIANVTYNTFKQYLEVPAE